MQYLNKKNSQILVCGYVREQEKLLQLSSVIPISIIPIIFEYQLYVETWNKEFSHPMVVITDNGCVEINKQSNHSNLLFKRTVYGNHIIKHGESFVWNLKIIEGTKCKILVGLIPNKKKTLLDHQESFHWHTCNGYVWCAFTGQFGFANSAINHNYSIKCFKNKNDTLTMKLNLNENSLRFICNGIDLGNGLQSKKAQDSIENDENTEFRFALCVQGTECKIMLSTDDQ